jgi:hypothetical protein
MCRLCASLEDQHHSTITLYRARKTENERLRSVANAFSLKLAAQAESLPGHGSDTSRNSLGSILWEEHNATANHPYALRRPEAVVADPSKHLQRHLDLIFEIAMLLIRISVSIREVFSRSVVRDGACETEREFSTCMLSICRICRRIYLP